MKSLNCIFSFSLSSTSPGSQQSRHNSINSGIYRILVFHPFARGTKDIGDIVSWTASPCIFLGNMKNKNFSSSVYYEICYNPLLLSCRLWTWSMNHDPAQIPDVNRGSLRSRIDLWKAKISLIYALISKVLNSGSFCQTADFIDPQNLGWILRIRKGLGSRVLGVSCAPGTLLRGFYGGAE